MPNELTARGCRAKITGELLPSGFVAVKMYEQELRASLNQMSVFGTDPYKKKDVVQNKRTTLESMASGIDQFMLYTKMV